MFKIVVEFPMSKRQRQVQEFHRRDAARLAFNQECSRALSAGARRVYWYEERRRIASLHAS